MEFPTNRTFDIVPCVHHRNFPQGLRTFGVFQPEGPEHKLISRDIILPPREEVHHFKKSAAVFLLQKKSYRQIDCRSPGIVDV